MDDAATHRESRTAGRRNLLVFCAVSAIAGAILYRFPSIDLFFAGLFHDPGNGFPAARDPDVQAIRKAFLWAGYVAFAAILLSLAARHLWGRYLFGLTRRSICFLVVFSILGPGLIVNHVFKDHWDRARPRAVVEFGGDKTFTPPLAIADQCETNCSFVSGEASYGFAFAALAFLVAPRWRRRVFWAAIGFGSIVGAFRMLVGAHFLSDVFFAGVFTVAMAWYAHREIVLGGRLDRAMDRLADLLGIPRDPVAARRITEG
ncbi:MAG: phosphatase PAP2 family protein [Defluviicoccus sp.]|nr:phosphatase PAP2 family protein [Defluviicoccus sp.]MDE0276672.1 phosphatase PAP2 family protein [Defluviicoccus sp.]